MFCCHCGKKLRRNSNFCYHCGIPPVISSGQTDANIHISDSAVCAEETCAVCADTGSAECDPTDSGIPSQDSSAIPAKQSDAKTPVIRKKGEITLSGSELILNKKHYFRIPGQKKFRVKKTSSEFSLDSVAGTSTERQKYGGRILLSLLLLLCCAAGALLSAHRVHNVHIAQNTPYRDQELAARERIMAVIDGDGGEQLLRCQEAQKENRADAKALSAELAGLKARQTQEILEAVCASDRFDPDDFFRRELFSGAYREYLQDLLNAFRADKLLDSWLYGYYETAGQYGGNHFLDTDLWIYNGGEGNKFSPFLESADTLAEHQYDLDLYEHILCSGRIYITGADFIKEVLALPRYVVDSAVLVKAYGGVPDAAAMSVPGWGRSHYEEFWLYGADYYGVDTPLWFDWGLQANAFEIDWNALVDETAYYNAYQDFMDKIAPGLPRYDMASYHADDTAPGGMGCSLTGTEATLSSLISSYAENHPAYIEELTESGIYGSAAVTSVDEEIRDTESQLEYLEKDLLALQNREARLTRLLAEADFHRNQHTLLLEDIRQHAHDLACRLLLFGGAAVLCLFAALFFLRRLLGLWRHPGYLFVISCPGIEYAFSTEKYSEDQLKALQSLLEHV